MTPKIVSVSLIIAETMSGSVILFDLEYYKLHDDQYLNFAKAATVGVL